MRLSEVDSDRNNNMDFIRFAGSLLVIYSHGYTLQGSYEPYYAVNKQPIGIYALYAFFALSGFLIAKSMQHAKSWQYFVSARILRVMPALVAVNLFTVIAGLFWTVLPASEYLSSPRPWMYFLRNTLLVGDPYTLPGVFEDNPFPNTVNGSLWTLPVEVRLYVMVFVAGVIAMLLRRVLWRRCPTALPLGIIGAASFALGAWGVHALRVQGAEAIDLPRIIMHPQAFGLCSIFSLGVLAQVCRKRIILDGRAVVASAMVLPFTSESSFAWPIFAVWFTYTCLWLMYTKRVNARGFGKRVGDLSYGIYVYSFPVQQWLYLMNPEMSVKWNIFVAAVIVVPFAWVSWRLVEKPAISMKTKLAQRLGASDPD